MVTSYWRANRPEEDQGEGIVAAGTHLVVPVLMMTINQRAEKKKDVVKEMKE